MTLAEEIWDVINNDLKTYKKLIKSKIIDIEENLKIELIKSMQDENKHISFIVKEFEDILI